MSKLLQHPAVWPMLTPGLDVEPHHAALDPESVERLFMEFWGRDSLRFEGEQPLQEAQG